MLCSRPTNSFCHPNCFEEGEETTTFTMCRSHPQAAFRFSCAHERLRLVGNSDVIPSNCALIWFVRCRRPSRFVSPLSHSLTAKYSFPKYSPFPKLCASAAPHSHTCPTFTLLTQLASFTLIPSRFSALPLPLSPSLTTHTGQSNQTYIIHTHIEFMHVCTSKLILLL